MVRTFVPAESLEEQWDLASLERVLRDEWQLEVTCSRPWSRRATPSPTKKSSKPWSRPAMPLSTAKIARVGIEQFDAFHAHGAAAKSLTQHWREHLASLDYLRQGIHLRGYAQKNPKQEYKREAFELFSQLLDVVKMEVTRTLLNVRIQSQEEADRAAQAMEARADQVSNVTYTHPNEDGSVSQDPADGFDVSKYGHVGRNDPCPCGSGKKFKACHGKLS